MKRSLFWLSIAFGVIGIGAALVHPIDWKITLGRDARSLSAGVHLHPAEAVAQTAEQGLETLRSQSQAFVQISKTILPSVVSITSERDVKVADAPGMGGFRFFGDDFFGHQYGGQDRTVPQTGVGSGVIVSKDGYVLTNNHVVADANKLEVTLQDGRSFKGELVGRDPKSDVAVVRIKAENLVPAKLGSSDKLQVGEWVLAVGNPFQLASTVTAGIVSAVGRSNIGLADYEDFIQTDAAINPGNSGGALVNLDGELIGINTAIATRSGGYQGIGFAIPIDMASKVMNSLITTGKVTRGYLGVILQPVTEDTAEIFGLDKPRGALVGQVADDGPAKDAGIQQGDVILAMDGRDVKDMVDLRLRVGEAAPGTKIDLTLLRGKKQMTVTAKLEEMKTDRSLVRGGDGSDDGNADEAQPKDLGLTVQDLNMQARRELDLSADLEGVVVTDVDPVKSAGRAGLRQGDVILKVGDAPVHGVRELKKELKGAPAGKPVLFLIQRGENQLFLAVRMPE